MNDTFNLYLVFVIVCIDDVLIYFEIIYQHFMYHNIFPKIIKKDVQKLLEFKKSPNPKMG